MTRAMQYAIKTQKYALLMVQNAHLQVQSQRFSIPHTGLLWKIFLKTLWWNDRGGFRELGSETSHFSPPHRF